MIKGKRITISPILLLALFSLILCWQITSNASESTGDRNSSVEVAGLRRTYRVHIPPSRNGAPRASPWSSKIMPTYAKASVGHPPVSEIRRSMIH